MRPKMTMVLVMALVAVLLGCGLFVGEASAQGSGAYEYASFLNRTGRFHHAKNVGAEVIYRSSGGATPEMARVAWMNSPPHRRLLMAGMIHDVQCVGSVCVGRSGGSSRPSNVSDGCSSGNCGNVASSGGGSCSSGNCSSGGSSSRRRWFRR